MPEKKHYTEEERRLARAETIRRYYLKNRESILIKTSAWAKKNKSRRANNLREWRAANKERYEATSRQWAEQNPDKIRATQKRSYEKNKHKMAEAHKKWIKDNPHLVNAYSGKRRIGKRFHPRSSALVISGIYKETHRLSRESGIRHATDHIIPVASGGYHHELNLQSMPKSMNESKHANPFWLAPSPEYKDWRDVPRELWPVDLRDKYLALIEQNKGVSIRWDTAA